MPTPNAEIETPPSDDDALKKRVALEEERAVDGALMKRVALGEEGAIKEFLNKFDPLIAGRIARLVWNEEDQKDVCQNVRLAILQSASTYDPSQSRLSTWVQYITVRRATDYLRRNTNYLRKTDLLDQDAVDHTKERSPYFDDVKASQIREAIRIIESLPDDVRAIFVMHELQQYTSGEIAELLNMSVGTVSTRLAKARALVLIAVSAPLAGCFGWGWAIKPVAVKVITVKAVAASVAAGAALVGVLYLLRTSMGPIVSPENLPNPNFDRLIAGAIYFHRFTDNPQQPGPSYLYRVRRTDSQLAMETSVAEQSACRMLQASSEVLLICESSAQAQSSHVDFHVGSITPQGVRLRSYLLDAPHNHFIGGGTGALTNSPTLPSCFVQPSNPSHVDPVSTIRRVCATHQADPFCTIPVAHRLERQERVMVDGSDEIIMRFHAEIDAPEWNGEITVASDSLRSASQSCRNRICDLTFRSAPVSAFHLTATYSSPIYLFDAASLSPAAERALAREEPCDQPGPSSAPSGS